MNDRRYQTHSDVVSLPLINIVTCSISSHLLWYFCFILQVIVAHSTFSHFLQIAGPKKLRARVLQHPLAPPVMRPCVHVFAIRTHQSVAQFMLSQADADSRAPETGLCFISDRNFVLLGALFAYFIPSSVAIVFAVLCRAEVRQLETHLYRGGRAYDWSCRTSTGNKLLFYV